MTDNQEPQDLSSLVHIQHGVQLNNETAIKFTTTEKGKPCIMENGFTYTKHRVYNNTFQWHCVVRKSCRARIHTIGTNVMKRTNEHTYEPNSKIFYCNEVKTGVNEGQLKRKNQLIRSLSPKFQILMKNRLFISPNWTV